QSIPDYHAHLPPFRRGVCALFPAAARSARPGTRPAVSGSPVHRPQTGLHRRRATALRSALLLSSHAPAPVDVGGHAPAQTPHSLTRGPVAGRSGASDRERGKPAASPLAAHSLWHRHTTRGTGPTENRRHRQRPHADPYSPGQRAEGSRCDPQSATARRVARLLAVGSVEAEDIP